MGNYQRFRGDPENKLFYLLNNFMGGINTEFSDDSSNDVDFESIINFDMDKLGTLNKRGGFGELTAISEIFNTLASNKLPNIKNRTPKNLNPENENDNVVYMKLLQNDNNCFRALSGFSGENAYRKYQEMYGFQQNRFKLLMITTSLTEGVPTSSTAWLYQCYLPELEYEDGEITDTETMTISCYKTTLPVVFNWDRNLMNLETIEFYDKIYFTGNDKCLVTFDRSTSVGSDANLASAFTYSGHTFTGNSPVNSAHIPSGLEIRHIGFNVLCTDPMHSIDTQGISTNSIQGLYVCTSSNVPLLSLPLGQKFLLNVMYTGDDNGFNIEMKEGDKDLTFDIDVNSTLSATGLKVYDVKFKDVPSGEVEIKVTKLNSSSEPLDGLEPYYDYYDVAQPDKEAKAVEQLNIGDYGICEMYNRAVYYKDDTIWFSDVNSFNYVPNYNYVTLPIEPTDKITKICYFKKSYIIFTKQKIYKMTGSFGTQDFAVSPVNTSLGCHAGNTVVPIEDTLYFSSPRGLYALRSSQFVEGFENVKELDLKVKKLTSDFTKYSEELSDPAVRFNGVSERAYATRYKDKYLLFYNNYNDKGDYAAVNDLDVLAYQFDIGAYTTYRFREKPTFLFMVDNAIETLATVAQKEEYTQEDVLVNYDFDTGSIEDLSGNDNDATMVGNLSLNKGVGVDLDGIDDRIKIDKVSGNISDGFRLEIETKIDEFSACELVHLEQSSGMAYGLSGSIETDYTDQGYKATFNYKITPVENLTNVDRVEYNLVYSRDIVQESTAITGSLTYSVSDIVPEKIVSFDLSERKSVIVDSGMVNIGRNADGTYSKNWELNVKSYYISTYIQATEAYGAPVTRAGVIQGNVFAALTNSNLPDSFIPFIRLGFSTFKATLDQTGYTISYTPFVQVKEPDKVNVDRRTLILKYSYGENGGKMSTIYHTVPEIRNTTGRFEANSGTIHIDRPEEWNDLYFTGPANLTFQFNMIYYINTTLKINKFGPERTVTTLSTGKNVCELPSISRNITTYPVVGTFNISASKIVTLPINYNSHRTIILKQVRTDIVYDNLEFSISSEYGDFTLRTWDPPRTRAIIVVPGIGLKERHIWSVNIAENENGEYICSINRDNDVITSAPIDKNLLVSVDRDLNYIGSSPEFESYCDGKVYGFKIENAKTSLVNFRFNEGTGTKAYDTASLGDDPDVVRDYTFATLENGTAWIVENGINFDGESGYLELPTFNNDVIFSNGFKIEFEGTLGNINNLAKIMDFATVYNNDDMRNDNCSINISVDGNVITFNSTSASYKTYKIIENTVDLTEKHKFKIDCVDNGINGYDISFIIDGVIISTDTFNYGGIADVKRTSNFIGKSNTTTDDLLRGILNNFKITMYVSESGTATYRSALYEFDTTSTDFGRPLYLELKTKAINMKYPQHLKKLKHIFVKAIGGYDYGELFFTLYGDGYIVNDPKVYSYYLDENGTVTQEYKEIKDLTIDERMSLLGNMRLDKTKIGEGLYQTRKLVIPKKAKNFAILISGDSTDYISIESIGYVCKLGKVKES